MYSFYGGQKGQDFRISKIFQNRSEDLLKDLQARWYSSVNVGDYVFISYGNITDVDKITNNPDGTINENTSNYNKNLNIDLQNCGKSYTNSIWQKVYIDNNKKLSPNFPDADNNVFVFINFKENKVEKENDTFYTWVTDPLTNELRKQLTDKDGNWLDLDGKIIRLVQEPGHSLCEVSDIYSDEYYGFGYRLIACVTGQTPRLRVLHQTINIEDGDPYVTCDLTNPDNPIIKFYQQRAQRIKKVLNNTKGPLEKPTMELLLHSEPIIIEEERIIPTLTEPVLKANLPRAIQYFSGPLFGQGMLPTCPTNYNSLNQLDLKNNEIFSITQTDIDKARMVASLLYNVLDASRADTNNISLTTYKETFDNFIEDEKDTQSLFLKQYYFSNGLLNYLNTTQEFNENMIPWGQYGFIKNETNLNNLYLYCKDEYNILSDIYSVLVNKELPSLDGEKPSAVSVEEEEPSVLVKTEEIAIQDTDWQNLESHGFLLRATYESLSREQKKIYIKSYISGLTDKHSLIMLLNLLPMINTNAKETILNLHQMIYGEGTEGTEDQTNSVSLPNISYIISFLSDIIGNLSNHFNILLNLILPGDLYINGITGKIYQFKNKNVEEEKKQLTAQYIGKFMAPAPVIKVNSVEFARKTNENEFQPNELSVFNNFSQISQNMDFDAQYDFHIPKSPEFTFNCNIIGSSEKATASSKINQDGYEITLGIPNTTHIYTKQTLPNILSINDNSPTNSDESLKIYDNNGILINNSHPHPNINKDDLFLFIDNGNNDIRHGNIYCYTGEGNEPWTKQGTILGPVGKTPVPSGEIIFINSNAVDEITYKKTDASANRYYFQKPDGSSINISNVINTIFKEILATPEEGALYLVQICNDLSISTYATGDENIEDSIILDNLEIIETSWAQYNNDNWYVSKITKDAAIYNDHIDDDNKAVSGTYSAKYINTKIDTIKTDIDAIKIDIETIDIDTIKTDIDTIKNNIKWDTENYYY